MIRNLSARKSEGDCHNKLTVTISPTPMTEARAKAKPGVEPSYEKPAERGGLNVNMAERQYDLGITTLINKAQPP